MAIADIQKKIEGEAAAKAAALLDEARAQADALNADAEKEIAKSKAEYDAMFDAEKPEVLKRAAIIANLDVKKITLGAKQSLIGKAYEGALAAMRALPQDKYLGFVERLLDQATANGDEELLVDASEKFINADFIAKYNAAHGKNLKLSEETADIGGGFIARAGRTSVNCSFPKLIDWVKESLQSEVVTHLFGADAR
jgi:V/A-type H+-transporting ATPase subunit E